MTPPTLVSRVIDDRYVVDAVIGSGGMGTVYAARDTRLGDRRCAIKVLAAQASTPTARARFEREVRLTATLQSRHIVKIDDAGHLPDGRPFVVMEHLDGWTLGEEIRRHGALHPERAIALIDGMLMGLAVAHAAGVVHRDIKPGNICLVAAGPDGQRPVLLDFGIARPYKSPDVTLTSHDALIGTPAYMSPEQITRGSLDGRSDLYAIGLVLHVMLLGQHPFPLDELPAGAMRLARPLRYLWCHLHLPFVPPPGISRPLAEVLRRLRERDPDKRFASAPEVMQALRQTPEGRNRPALDPARVAALEPKTVPVAIGDLDFDAILDTVATPALVAPAPLARPAGISDTVKALAIAGAVMIVGGAIYWLSR